MKPLVFLVTCEHGGNRIPPEFRALFRGHARLLQTHEGYDHGALDMARDLAAALRATLVASTVSRLLVELNRSPTHPSLFSRVVREAPADVRARIYERHYMPYRTEVETFVAEAVGRGARVLHVSSHSFTPVLDGDVRRADIGLLYDPAREREGAFCERWQSALRVRLPAFRVRRNYPYRGDADGLTTYMRKHFDGDVYAGVEIEMNQRHARAPRAAWRATRGAVVDALMAALAPRDAAARASARP